MTISLKTEAPDHVQTGKITSDVTCHRRQWSVYAPGKSGGRYLRRVWEAREILFFLAWRDFKARYKQTMFGAAWAVVQPVAMMLVFAFLFGRMARTKSDGIPYPVFAYSGLVLWQLFASAFVECCNSVVANERLLTKVAFPRQVIPLSSVATSIADAAVASLVLILLLAWYRIGPRPFWLLWPALIVLTTVAALSVGTWLAALNVRFRDVRYAIPFLIQPLLFLTPVAYPSSLVPDRWRLLYALNPMAGIIEMARWSLFGTATRPGAMLAISAAAMLTLLVGGIRYFGRAERSFADVA